MGSLRDYLEWLLWMLLAGILIGAGLWFWQVH
jgi:hypothetical protein